MRASAEVGVLMHFVLKGKGLSVMCRGEDCCFMQAQWLKGNQKFLVG